MRPEHWLFTIPLRLRSLFRWAQADQELDDELRDHLERKMEEYVAKGMAPEEARRRARLDLGGIERIKEKCRDARHVNWIQDFVQDLQFGLRILPKSPGFTVVAVLTLALGIGSVTTIFSVIDNVLLNPFPYADARRVVMVYIHDVKESERGGRSFFSTPEFLDYQEQNHVFDAVIGGAFQDVLYSGSEGTELFDGGSVTPNLFHVLGVPALVGRGITPEDGKPGAPPVFVISYKMWRKRFNLDPSVLGRTFTLNGTARTLVGIMPPRFTKMGADLWIPTAPDRSDPEGKQRYFMFQGHLKPGVTLHEAQADIDVLAHRLAQVYTKDYPQKFTVEVVFWVDWLVSGFRPTLYTLAAAVSLLLLIACSNVANMLLARATAREKEIAIRASLGASRGRLIRQLLMESLLLALGGAALGCVDEHRKSY